MATIARLLVGLGLDAKQYSSGVDIATRHTQSFVDTANDRFNAFSIMGTGSLMRVGEMAVETAAKIARAIGDQAIAAFKLVGDYQQNMAVFATVSNASAEDMTRVAAKAKALGADLALPGVSAADAAATMLELGKAGLSVDNVLAAARGTMALSAAGLDDNARAAEIAANALNAFKLSGDRVNFVSDLLAGAANKSSVDIKDVADSFKMASAVFSAFQGPVEGSEKAMISLTTSIALLGNAGIKGSDAGTSLKQALLQLTGPSQKAKEQMKGLAAAAFGFGGNMDDVDKILFGNATKRNQALKGFAAAGYDVGKMGDLAYDASGKMRPFKEIIELTAAATKNMTDEQRNSAITSIFGADATRAIITLMQAGPAAFDEMTAAITREGAASEVAAARNSGLKGALDGFKSVYETLQLEMAEPLAEPVERGIRVLTQAMSDAIPGLVEFAVTALLPAMNAVIDFLEAFIDAPNKTKFLVSAVQDAYNSVMGWIASKRDAWVATALDWLNWLQIEGKKKYDEYSVITLKAITDGYNAVMKYITDNKQEWIDTSLEWITGASEFVGKKITEFTPKVVDGLLSMLPEIIKATGDLATGAISWLAGDQPAISKNTETMMGKIGKSFDEHGPLIYDAGKKAIKQFTLALVMEGIPAFSAAVVLLMAQFGRYILDLAKKAEEEGSLGRAIFDALFVPLSFIKLTGFYDIGRKVIDSFYLGILECWNDTIKKISGLWDQLPQSIRDTLGMHSPSTVMVALGANAAGSFIDGGLSMLRDAEQAANALGMAITPTVGDVTAPNVSGMSDEGFSARAAIGSSDGDESLIINNYGSVITKYDLFQEVRDWLERKTKDTRAQ